MTQNPINALNIPIYNTKHFKYTKTHFKSPKSSKKQKRKFKEKTHNCILLYIDFP